ncbi:tryptophan-rich sensory protein [Pseudarthrobacter sp. NamE5]|uniref:tryptophan-rich sensory protein n=1 Tax=Pseudarthrobacter sp. NamE5 TaxID=2576839 RepID=UPI00110A925D|nr:tryptophan-rich sensory protein [Pseudarthrobacter sp. NamE5]TLM84163.1 hypothetical protein FDW84_12915 [Pseudarthrobacter sp. NamE5]
MQPNDEELMSRQEQRDRPYSGRVQALAIILALIAAVAVTILYFGPISRTAGLLLPYMAWIVFASTLN